MSMMLLKTIVMKTTSEKRCQDSPKDLWTIMVGIRTPIFSEMLANLTIEMFVEINSKFLKGLKTVQ